MSPDPRLSELLDRIEHFNRHLAMNPDWLKLRAAAAQAAPVCNCHGTMAGSHDPECPMFHARGSLAAVLLGGTPQPQDEEKKADPARVAPLTAGADGQDLPRPAPAVEVIAAAKETVHGLKKWLRHEADCAALIQPLVPPYLFCSCGLLYGFDSVLQAFDILAGHQPAAASAFLDGGES